MSRRLKSILVIPLFLFFCAAFVFAEEVTITTYYPSPYGSYNQLQTSTLGIGDNNGDTILTAADVPPVGSPGEVWINGNVGIGTGIVPPTDKLEVNGTTLIRSDATGPQVPNWQPGTASLNVTNSGINWGGRSVAIRAFTNGGGRDARAIEGISTQDLATGVYGYGEGMGGIGVHADTYASCALWATSQDPAWGYAIISEGKVALMNGKVGIGTYPQASDPEKLIVAGNVKVFGTVNATAYQVGGVAGKNGTMHLSTDTGTPCNVTITNGIITQVVPPNCM